MATPVSAARGHRPFFLGAAAFACLSIGGWLAVLDGAVAVGGPLAASRWHGHEMIFGYTIAVLSGFLLTTTRGWRIWVLLGLWMLGRAGVMLTGWVPLPVTAGIDVLYLPVLALLRDPPVWRRPKWPTIGFLPLLLALGAINAAFYLDVLGMLPGASERALQLAIDLLTLMIVVMAGRLVPGYTRAMLIPIRAPRDPWRERLSIVLVLLMLALDAIGMLSMPGAIAIIAGTLQAVRLAGWRTRDVLRQPLLLALHIGFAWIALGLVLRGVADLTGWITHIDALHGITVGAIGTLTLAMMARLTRTHGRLPPGSDTVTSAAFVAITIAALLRGVGGAIAPAAALPTILVSGVVWIVAFGLFLVRYARTL